MPPTHWLRGRMDPSHTCGVLQRHRTIHKHGSRRAVRMVCTLAGLRRWSTLSDLPTRRLFGYISRCPFGRCQGSRRVRSALGPRFREVRGAWMQCVVHSSRGGGGGAAIGDERTREESGEERREEERRGEWRGMCRSALRCSHHRHQGDGEGASGWRGGRQPSCHTRPDDRLRGRRPV